MNMNAWLDQLIHNRNKTPFPLLAYPAVQMMFISVKELVTNPNWQAMGMRLIADRWDMPAVASYMDLSVEAEAFGATCVYGEDEVPTIVGRLVSNEEEAQALQVPEIGAGRTAICIEGVQKSMRLINDRPIFANCIGPYSLAGRLLNVNDIMLMCYEDPDTVHTVLRKATDFIKKYIAEYVKIGCDGIVLAEPLAGILSPDLMEEFSTAYVKEITEEFQSDSFLIIYHNCGSAVERLLPQVLDTGCKAFHFGDHVNLKNILEHFPSDRLVMGNISPSSVFNGRPVKGVKSATQKLLWECMNYDNFLISSGCDIPPDTELDNIDAFFDTVKANYYKRYLAELIM
ncbi:MAG: uroporphyrinogen decarboxylase family protein [Oscillospiraceae bacterium]|nr:uroporphyrinogen decarboxylase family protein [Oscillospiraceae bacterium]